MRCDKPIDEKMQVGSIHVCPVYSVCMYLVRNIYGVIYRLLKTNRF